MKKNLFTAVFFVLSAFFLNAEKVVIDWQGSDEGISYEPAWLSQFLNKKKDEKLRDFFSLKKNDLYFIGIEENIDLEMAKNTARTNAVKQASEKLCTECGFEKDSKVRLNGLELKYSFWQEIAEENDESSVSEYKAFCIYTITAENWKILSNNLHTSFKDILATYRIRYAEALLVVTDLPILDISLASGFNSERTFTRLFKERNGITPSAYRSQYLGEST